MRRFIALSENMRLCCMPTVSSQCVCVWVCAEGDHIRARRSVSQLEVSRISAAAPSAVSCHEDEWTAQWRRRLTASSVSSSSTSSAPVCLTPLRGPCANRRFEVKSLRVEMSMSFLDWLLPTTRLVDQEKILHFDCPAPV